MGLFSLVGDAATFLDWFYLVSNKDLVSDLGLQSGVGEVNPNIEMLRVGCCQK